MFKFQIGAYKTWRSFWVAAGYFWSGTAFAVLIRDQNFLEWPIFFLVTMLLLPFVSPFTRYFLSQIVKGKDFVFDYFLFKQKISINNIKSLSYEQRPAWRYLVLKYIDKKGKEVGKEWSVDFYDPIVISALNENLKQHNPSITILFDNKFKVFMEKQKDLHKKAPNTILGWIWFAVRWGGITAIINIGVLELIRYIDPSVFK